MSKKFPEAQGFWALPRWQRHGGLSAILVFIFAALQLVLGSKEIDWLLAGGMSFLVGLIEAAVVDEDNTYTQMVKDILLNSAGIAFVLLAMLILGNKPW